MATRMTTAFHKFEPYEKGRTRNFRFDINALADFEQLTGMGFGQLMQMRAIFATCRAMLYAGLKYEDRALTLEAVGDLIGEYINDPNITDASVDDLMTVAVEAAVDQGALGRAPRESREKNARAGRPGPVAVLPAGPAPAPLQPLDDEPKS